MRYFYSVLLFLILSRSVSGYTFNEISRLKDKCLNRVELHHVAVGLEVDANDNYYISPKFFYGIGSYRNLLNIDVGVKFKFSNLLAFSQKESLSVRYFNPFVSIDLNPVRWNSGCICLGAEASYCLVMSASHRLSEQSVVIKDMEIGRNHLHLKAKAGVKSGRLDVSVFLDHNLAPMINQKYIYESVDYDYDQLITGLYERYRLGFSVSYHIPF